MIKAIIFDLDGTLLDRQASLQKFIAHQYERLHAYLGHVPKDQYISRFIELDHRGYVWKDKVYEQLISEFSIEKISWQELLDDYVCEFHKCCVAFPNLHKMLEELHKKVQLGMITNGKGPFQMDNIKALGIEHYFNSILISEWEGMSKPQSEIFEKSVSDLGVLPSESLYVGDHPENDIKGAQAAGMKAAWKRDPFWDKVNADFVIDDLMEIPLLVNL